MPVESMNNIHKENIPTDEGTNKRTPPVVGVLGGIGSGKSAVAQWATSSHSICLIDGDQIGHEVLKQEEVKQAILKRFGKEVFSADENEVDRTILGKLVFGTSLKSREALADLEAIVHPGIREEFSVRISEAKTSGLCDIILLDAAVLLESEWDVLCDATIFVDTPREERLGRVASQRGWDDAELAKREACQIPVSDKQKRADYVVHNNGSLENAGEQFEAILKEIQRN